MYKKIYMYISNLKAWHILQSVTNPCLASTVKLKLFDGTLRLEEEKNVFFCIPRKWKYNCHLKRFWFCSSNNKYNFVLLIKPHTSDTKYILKRHLTVQLHNCTFNTLFERHKTACGQSEWERKLTRQFPELQSQWALDSGIVLGLWRWSLLLPHCRTGCPLCFCSCCNV